MELPIIFEDQDVVVVAKPAGVMTHPDGHTTEETVSDWFAARYPESAEVGETQRLVDGTEIARPGVMHRLDRDTSGVLILAKNQETHTFLKEAFKERTAHKTYLACIYGVPKERRGTIDFAIGRSRKDFRLRSAQPRAKGTMRDALTKYEVVSDIGTHALVVVKPETGRTHQIRVHLKAIHHPIVCDPLYAPGRPCDLGMSRLALHALSIDVPMRDGSRRTFTAPVPEDMRDGIQRFPGYEAAIAS